MTLTLDAVTLELARIGAFGSTAIASFGSRLTTLELTTDAETQAVQSWMITSGDSLTLTSEHATGTITLDSSIDVSVATSVTLNAKTVSLTQTGSFSGISISLGTKVMTLALTTAAETQALASWMFPANIMSVSVTSTHATGEITLDKSLTLPGTVTLTLDAVTLDLARIGAFGSTAIASFGSRLANLELTTDAETQAVQSWMITSGDSLTLTSEHATGTITLDSSIDVSVATSVTLNAKTVSLTQTGSFTGISISLGNKVMALALTTAAETQALASWMFIANIMSVSVTSTHTTGEITLDKALTLPGTVTLTLDAVTLDLARIGAFGSTAIASFGNRLANLELTTDAETQAVQSWMITSGDSLTLTSEHATGTITLDSSIDVSVATSVTLNAKTVSLTQTGSFTGISISLGDKVMALALTTAAETQALASWMFIANITSVSVTSTHATGEITLDKALILPGIVTLTLDAVTLDLARIGAFGSTAIASFGNRLTTLELTTDAETQAVQSWMVNGGDSLTLTSEHATGTITLDSSIDVSVATSVTLNAKTVSLTQTGSFSGISISLGNKVMALELTTAAETQALASWMFIANIMSVSVTSTHATGEITLDKSLVLPGTVTLTLDAVTLELARIGAFGSTAIASFGNRLTTLELTTDAETQAVQSWMVNDGDSLTLTSEHATGTITLDSSIDVSVATSVTLNAKTVSLTQTGSFTGISISLGNKVMALALTTAAETQALASWMFPTNIMSVSVTSTHATGEITLDKSLTLPGTVTLTLDAVTLNLARIGAFGSTAIASFGSRLTTLELTTDAETQAVQSWMVNGGDSLTLTSEHATGTITLDSSIDVSVATSVTLNAKTVSLTQTGSFSGISITLGNKVMALELTTAAETQALASWMFPANIMSVSVTSTHATGEITLDKSLVLPATVTLTLDAVTLELARIGAFGSTAIASFGNRLTTLELTTDAETQAVQSWMITSGDSLTLTSEHATGTITLDSAIDVSVATSVTLNAKTVSLTQTGSFSGISISLGNKVMALALTTAAETQALASWMFIAILCLLA